MSWWTTVAGLTPIAVHDADNLSGFQFLDRVGTNHVTATFELAAISAQLVKSVTGNGSIMSYTDRILLPTNCTICILYVDSYAGYATSTFSDSVSKGWVLHHETTTNWSIASTPSTTAVFGALGFYSTFQFASLVKTGTGAVMYVNGGKHGGTLTNYLPPGIDRIGSAYDSVYNFKSDDYLAAFGIWDGAAAQTDLVALEAACRAALAVQRTSRGFTGVVGRLDGTPPAALNPAGTILYTSQMARLPLLQNAYAGIGHISGTVKKKASPSNLPLARKVRLFHERTGQLVAETWSDPVTGVYVFSGLDTEQIYTAIAYDYTHEYRAVAADNLSTELA